MRWRLNIRILLVAIVALGALLRFGTLSGEPLWIDERLHLQAATAPSLGEMLTEVATHAAAAPLDYLLLRAFVSVAGSEAVIEGSLPYVLYGLVTILFVFMLGRQIYDERVGLLAAFFLALSFFHIYYSQEIRFYALSALLGVLATLAFVRVKSRNTWQGWAAWCVVCVLGLYTHYFLALLFAMQFVWLAAGQPGWRRLVAPSLALGAAVLTFMPWLLWAGNGADAWDFAFGIAFLPALVLFISAIGPALAFLVFSPFGLFRKAESWLLATSVALPFFGVFALDNIAGYFFSPRQLIFTIPLASVLCAGAIVTFGDMVWERAQRESSARTRMLLLPAGILLLIVFTGASLLQLLNHYG